MRVKYLAQEHNAVPQPGLEPGPFDPESNTLTVRPPRLPCGGHTLCIYHVSIIKEVVTRLRCVYIRR